MGVRRVAAAALAAATLVGVVAFAQPLAAAELVARGVYRWDEPLPGFGGFSGLVMAGDGLSLIAASDAGDLFRARLSRDAEGRIRRIETTWTGRFLDNFGKPVEGFTADAEALAAGADGTVFVAFESYARIAGFRPPDMMPEPQNRWDRFKRFWGNEGFEALAITPEGQLVAVLERATGKPPGYQTFLGRDGRWQAGPVLPAGGGFAAVGADFGPDGRFYLLERRVNLLARFSTRIRRFDYAQGAFGAAQTLMTSAPGALGNMEAISLWTDAAGQVVVSLVSDDNFLPLQETTVVEFALKE